MRRGGGTIRIRPGGRAIGPGRCGLPLLFAFLMAAPGCTSFEVDEIEYPERVTVNTGGGDLTVHYRGTPTFPVVLAFRLRSGAECPEGIDCLSPIAIFNDQVDVLVAEGVVRCEGEISSAVFMDYEVVLVDENEVYTAPIEAGFRCEP